MSKTAVITGATSGIGVEIVKYLIQKRYEIAVIGRSKSKMESLKTIGKELDPSVKLHLIQGDLSSFESIQKACDTVKMKFNQVDLLLLNAGLMNFEMKETVDGIEETLQVNVLSTYLIYDQLKNLIPKNDFSKVIFTASALHQGTIYFDDIEFRKSFSGFKSYRQSKLALILLTRYLASSKEHEGHNFYAIHPGIVNTELSRNAGWFSKLIFSWMGISPYMGAQTHFHLIDYPNSELVSGEYYAKSEIKNITRQSNNMELAKRLFDTVNSYLPKSKQETIKTQLDNKQMEVS